MTTFFERDIPDVPGALKRLNAVMTYAEIGKAVGVDGDSIGRYIDGSRKRIGYDIMWRIMRLYYRKARQINVAKP